MTYLIVNPDSESPETPLAEVALHIFTVKLLGDPRGEFVTVFAPDRTAHDAVRKGFDFLGQPRPVAPAGVHRMRVEDWTAYVREFWPDLGGQLPQEKEVLERVARGEVFLGPFLRQEDCL